MEKQLHHHPKEMSKAEEECKDLPNTTLLGKSFEKKKVSDILYKKPHEMEKERYAKPRQMNAKKKEMAKITEKGEKEHEKKEGY